ncbi:hypothetical protein HOY82DRAFT_635005 [Tuber indicum]|nr:hypothetical protein HOY82DRAFT_635005 [Tuber indicum]
MAAHSSRYGQHSTPDAPAEVPGEKTVPVLYSPKPRVILRNEQQAIQKEVERKRNDRGILGAASRAAKQDLRLRLLLSVESSGRPPLPPLHCEFRPISNTGFERSALARASTMVLRLAGNGGGIIILLTSSLNFSIPHLSKFPILEEALKDRCSMRLPH